MRSAVWILLVLAACAPSTLAGPPEVTGRSTEPIRAPGHSPARPLPPAIEIPGLPGPPEQWPDPVPTIWDDGFHSIRAIELEAEHFLHSAGRGEIVGLWGWVRGHEQERTWIVDRSIDGGDAGLALVPALDLAPGSRVAVVGELALVEVSERGPRAMLRVHAWSMPGRSSWSDPEGASVELPRDGWTEPTDLLRRGAAGGPRELAGSAAQAMDALAAASLADDGALAERHARRAIELAPADVGAWSTLIAIYHGYDQPVHLVAALHAADDRGLDQLEGLWLAYGSLAVESGRFGLALELLARAVELDPGDLAATFYLATAKWLSGDQVGARADYAKVVELARSEAPLDEIGERMIQTAIERSGRG